MLNDVAISKKKSSVSLNLLITAQLLYCENPWEMQFVTIC
jgi:hypothetical protein